MTCPHCGQQPCASCLRLLWHLCPPTGKTLPLCRVECTLSGCNVLPRYVGSPPPATPVTSPLTVSSTPVSYASLNLLPFRTMGLNAIQPETTTVSHQLLKLSATTSTLQQPAALNLSPIFTSRFPNSLRGTGIFSSDRNNLMISDRMTNDQTNPITPYHSLLPPNSSSKNVLRSTAGSHSMNDDEPPFYDFVIENEDVTPTAIKIMQPAPISSLTGAGSTYLGGVFPRLPGEQSGFTGIERVTLLPWSIRRVPIQIERRVPN